MKKETNRNEEIQSRREFFKKAAKSVLPIVCLVVAILFSSCEDNERGLAPKSIVGKTLDSDWPTMNFITESKLYYPSVDDYTSYTYTKVSDNVGKLTWEFCDGDRPNGGFYAFGGGTFILNFTSKESGWYESDGVQVFTLY